MSSSAVRWVAVMLVGQNGVLACSDRTDVVFEATTPGPARVLLPLTDLRPLAGDADPLAAHRPDVVVCSNVAGWYFEGGLLEVNTGRCNYLALGQPASLRVPVGASLTTQLRHFDLTSPEPTTAHVALTIRDVVVWEERIPVPSEARVTDITVDLPVAVETGDELGIHLHNHGQNTYNFAPWLVSATIGSD